MQNQEHSSHPLLTVTSLKKLFPIRHGLFSRVTGNVRAVDNVSFTVERGRTLGLVGESGCGKTTTGRCILRLIEPSDGNVVYDDINVISADNKQLRDLRKKMQIVFQDPYSSLNPRITIGGMLSEILLFHKLCGRREVKERVAGILESVGLSPVYAGRYPHEFSGGQRQRIGIARALSVNPRFIVLDEPVSALDVSIQAQILNLLVELREKLNLAYLFIAHDLSVVDHIADEIAVMYLGRIVESGPAAKVINEPLHPYTKALINAVPLPDPRLRKDSEPLGGDVPSPANPPPGCHFHPRCKEARAECREWLYDLKEYDSQRRVACLLYPSRGS